VLYKKTTRHMFQTEGVEKIKTHFVFSNFFFFNRDVYERMWENIVQRDSLHDKMAHAHCMLDS